MLRTLITASLAWFLLLSTAGIAVQAQDGDNAKYTAAQQAAIDKVRQLGGLAMELAQNDKRFVVALHLTDQPVTDESLAVLKEMPEVVQLNLRGTDVTDAGLVHLKPLTSLERLHLERTKITDAGLQHLAGLSKLEYLNLYGTEITDAGLKHLAGIKSLKKIYLWESKATDAGVAELAAALPEAEIVREFVPAKPRVEEPAVAQKPKADG